MKIYVRGTSDLAKATINYLKNCEVIIDLPQDNGTTTIVNTTTGEELTENDLEDLDFIIATEKGQNGNVIRYTLTEDDIDTEEIYWPTFDCPELGDQRIVMSMNGYHKGLHKYLSEGVHFLSTKDAILSKLYTNLFVATRRFIINSLAGKADNVPATISAVCSDSRVGAFDNYPEPNKSLALPVTEITEELTIEK